MLASNYDWGRSMIRLVRYTLLAIHFVIGSLLGLTTGILRPFHPTNSRICAQSYSKIGLPIIGIKMGTTVWSALLAGRQYPDRQRQC